MELRGALPARIDVYEAAYPNDAARDFGITLVPFAYVASAGRVVATGSPKSREELSSLLKQVAAGESEMDASMASGPESNSGIVSVSGARAEAEGEEVAFLG
jgi:hypothetical protein